MFSLIAQTTIPVLPQTPPTTITEWASLTSVTAVILATIVIISALKEPLSKIPWLGKWPFLVQNIIIAFTLTCLANLVLGSLPGSLPDLLWQTFVNVLIANGVYNIPSSLKSPVTSESRSSSGTLPTILLAMLIPVGLIGSAGCEHLFKAAQESPATRMFTAKTPADKVAAAEAAYADVANGLADAIQSGIITDRATIKAIADTDRKIQPLLDTAKLLAVNDQAEFDKQWPAIRDQVYRFILDYAAARQKKET